METLRYVRSFMWVDPNDCDPPHGLDMRSNHDADKVALLKEAFQREGFNLSYPALVGYPLNGRIQLVSGTHRHAAAQQAGIKLPITLWLRSSILELWGTDLWSKVILDIPVHELTEYPVVEGATSSPYDRIDLSNIYTETTTIEPQGEPS